MTGTDNERSVLPPFNPGRPANRAAAEGGSREAGGRVYTFHGMSAPGAARKLERIWAAKQMVANTTTTETRYEPFNIFTIPENDEIKGPPLVGNAQSTAVPGFSTSAKDIALPTDPNAPGQPGTSPPNRPAIPDPETTVPEVPVPAKTAPPPAPVKPPPSPEIPPKQATPSNQTSPAPVPQQQPNSEPQQQQPTEPKPDQSAQIPDRIDPELLKTMPSLSSIYNNDGTRKTAQQQTSERTAHDIVDLPRALADNKTGVTPLGGGGKVEKTVTATTDDWQVNQTVTLANGSTTTISSKPGIDVEELDNGRTATTLSYKDAATQARTDLGRVNQGLLTPGQVQPGNAALKAPSPVFGSAITDADEANQLVDAIERLKANPNAPVRVVKDKDGQITSLSVLGADGREHVMVLNAGGVSYDQNNTKLFEFYRGLDGKITTPDGHPIINIDGHNIRVDSRGVPVLPDNPFAQNAGVVSSNGFRTDRPHGARLAPNLADLPPGTGRAPSATPSITTPYNSPLQSPVGPAADGRFYVELPSGDLSAIGAINNSDLAAIEEIPVPPGVTADRMYKVQGGGLLIENTTGLHWATDPGNIRTGEQIGADITKTVANELIWTVAGEGLGYVAVRAGAKILPKIATKLDEAAGKAGAEAATKPGQILDDTASTTRRAADEPTPSGFGQATNDLTPKIASPIEPRVRQPTEPKPAIEQPAGPSAQIEATIAIESRTPNPSALPAPPQSNLAIGLANRESDIVGTPSATLAPLGGRQPAAPAPFRVGVQPSQPVRIDIEPIAGRPGIKAFRDDDVLYLRSDKIPPIPGVFDVAIHGSPRSVGFQVKDGAPQLEENWHHLSHRDIAALMSRHGWKPGQDVRLLSCLTGSLPDGFARNLANKLGVTVWAPTDYLWVYRFGRIKVAPYDDAGKTIHPTKRGTFSPFSGRKNEWKAGNS